jgi:hypothetical protein
MSFSELGKYLILGVNSLVYQRHDLSCIKIFSSFVELIGRREGGREGEEEKELVCLDWC